jgi:hypothetical protein
VPKFARRPRAEPYVGLVGDHADKLSRIEPIRHVEEAVPEPAKAPRLKPRWYFLAALALAVLAFWVLPTPFSGFAALACVGAFITGGARHITGGDPEMVKRVTRGGIVGGPGV